MTAFNEWEVVNERERTYQISVRRRQNIGPNTYESLAIDVMEDGTFDLTAADGESEGSVTAEHRRVYLEDLAVEDLRQLVEWLAPHLDATLVVKS